MSLLRLATWNVHGCVGADGVENPERIASVIRELDPDIIGLQEMREGALPRIAELTGLHAIAGVTRPEFRFGNALLTRHALVQDAGAPLLAVMGDVNEWRPFVRTLHRLNTHLGPSRGVRSFPSYLPVFRLDRVWVSPHQSLLEVRAWKGRGVWRASDHLPVTALVELKPRPQP